MSDRDLIKEAQERTGLSARALAALLAVDERNVRRWIESGTIGSGAARQLLRVTVAAPNLVMDTLDVHPRPPGWMVSAAQRSLPDE